MESKRHYKSTEIKKRFSITLFIVFALELAFLFSVNIIVGGLLIAVTFGILFIKSGVEIDPDNNRMRSYFNFFGIETGNWISIPNLKYVSVVRIKTKKKSFQASSDMFVQTSSNNVKFNVNLITEDKRKRFIRILSADKDEAINKALELGNVLDLRVLDYTTANEVWLK